MESGLGSANVQIFDELAWSQQPKERIESVSYQFLTSKMCTNFNYRKSAEMLNLLLHRDKEDSIKSRTFADSMNHIGSKISRKLKEVSGKVLMMSGFNKETGLSEKDVVLSKNIQIPNIQAKDTSEEQYIQNAIDNINAKREEKIPFNARELEIETKPEDCVYISIDDVGVKHQKSSHKQEETKNSKYIENTVAQIQYGENSYAPTAIGMRETIKLVLSFLLFNNFLDKELIFLTDGAKNIKSHIYKWCLIIANAIKLFFRKQLHKKAIIKRLPYRKCIFILFIYSYS